MAMRESAPGACARTHTHTLTLTHQDKYTHTDVVSRRVISSVLPSSASCPLSCSRSVRTPAKIFLHLKNERCPRSVLFGVGHEGFRRPSSGSCELIVADISAGLTPGCYWESEAKSTGSFSLQPRGLNLGAQQVGPVWWRLIHTNIYLFIYLWIPVLRQEEQL